MAKWNHQSIQSDLAAFSDDPRVQQELRRRRRRIIVISVAICLIVGLGAPPAYRAFRTYQINRNLEAAKAAARVEDWGTARNKARSVLLARPGDFDAYRIWHKALSHMNEPRTYMVAAHLFMDPRATREDRLFALGVLARQGPEAVALGAFASMEESMRQEAPVLAALSPLLIRRGHTAVVEKTLRESLAAGTDPAIQLELLRSLCSTPTADRVKEARGIFASLIAANASDPALQALLVLAETPGGLASGEPLPPLPEWVQAQPKASTLHHLYALHPEIDEAGDASGPIFQRAIDRFLDLDAGTLGTWLIRHNLSGRAADLLEPAAQTSPSAYIARLHALLRTKRSDEITALLETPPDSCDLVDLWLAKAAAARMREDRTAEANAWLNALNNAAFDQSRNRFLEIGQYATTLGAGTVIEDSWVAGVRIGWGPIPLYRDLRPVFASLSAKSRSEDLLAMFRTLLRFEPMNAELLNNYHYLALLHEVQSPADSASALENLVAAAPDQPEFLSALAFAHLMADQPEPALALIPALRQSKLVAPMMVQALEGTARVLAGEADAGRQLLDRVNWRLFMRVEAHAFRKILTRREISDLPLPPMELIATPPDPENAPAWRRAVERLEQQRSKDTLPALPTPHIPGTVNAD